MSNLRIAGPTPLPPPVLKAGSKQMINHRGSVYEAIQSRVVKNLQHFFQTNNHLYILTSSGTGALEASITNFFSRGETIISLSVGVFGDRWADIGLAYGAKVIKIPSVFGKSIDWAKFISILKKNPKTKGVLVTHNETSTGVLNDVGKVSKILKLNAPEALLLVDGISSLGGVDLPMDKLGIDTLASASQKAWMAPPGLSFIAVSNRAWKRVQKSDMPRYYFDLRMAEEFALKNQTPATPAVGILQSLDISLELMKKEGRREIFKRHIEQMKYFRSGVGKLGLQLLVSDMNASPTVTSIVVPSSIDAKNWLSLLNTKYGVVLSGGMGQLKGKIIRVAHMGYCSKADLDGVLNALDKSVKTLSK